MAFMTQGVTRRCAWGQISLYINSRPCPPELAAISNRNIYTIDRTFRQTRTTFDIYHLFTPIQVPITCLDTILVPRPVLS